MIGNNWNGRWLLLAWVVLSVIWAVAYVAVDEAMDPGPFPSACSNISYSDRVERDACEAAEPFRSEREAFRQRSARQDSALTTVGVSGVGTFVILSWFSLTWLFAGPRRRMQTWITGWHPGQLVIAWVGVAVLLLPLLVALEAEGEEEGMAFLAVSTVLAMLGVTWKWFGGRPK